MPPENGGLEPGIFCAIHTYGRRLNWHPHVHVSVTCGGLNKHGQWKKLSFLKDAMRSRWMWNMRQLLLKAWSEGMAMPESLSHITTESQWRSPVLKSGGKILACVHVEEDSRRAEYGTLPGVVI